MVMVNKKANIDIKRTFCLATQLNLEHISHSMVALDVNHEVGNRTIPTLF